MGEKLPGAKIVRSAATWIVLQWTWVALIVVLAIFAWVVSLLLSFLSDANPSVAAPVIAGLFAVFSLMFTYWRDRSRSIREAHRDKKIEIYTKFAQIISALMSENARKNLNPSRKQKSFMESAKFFDEMIELKTGIIFYGSADVVQAFNAFQHNPDSAGTSARNMIVLIDNVIRAMREDIGLSNAGLGPGELQSIFITDFDESMSSSS